MFIKQTSPATRQEAGVNSLVYQQRNYVKSNRAYLETLSVIHKIAWQLLITHSHSSARCCKCDEASQWKSKNSTPRHAKTPWPIFTKIGMLDYVMDIKRHAELCRDRFRGFCSPNTWFCRVFGVTSFFFVFWVLQWGYSLHPQTYFYAQYVGRRSSGHSCSVRIVRSLRLRKSSGTLWNFIMDMEHGTLRILRFVGNLSTLYRWACST